MTRRQATLAFLADGGEMGALMRAHDWSASPLGPPTTWPQPLRTAVRLLLNTGHPMYIFWGAAGACLYNDAYRLTIGHEHHPGSLGRPAREVWIEIWSIIGPQFDYVMAGHGATWHEDQLVSITRNGVIDDVYWTYSYGPIDDGTAPDGVGGVLVICAETTGNVLAKQQLAAEMVRQRRVFEQAPGFIAVLRGPEHRFEFVNEAYARLLGRRALIDRTVREALPEIEGQGYFELLDQVYETGERFVGHQQVIHLQNTPGLDADERFLDFVYEPMRDEAGHVTGIFIEGHDVTERRRVEAALQELNEKLEQRVEERTRERDRLWQNSQDLLAVIDAQGMVHAVSPIVTKILGWAPDEMVGRSVFEFVHPERHLATKALLAQAARNELPARDNRYRHKDGSYRWISWVSAPEGELIYATGRHVTSEKAAAVALERSQARLRAIFETSYQMQGLLALDGTLLDANATSLAVIGSQLPDVVGEPFWDTPWFTATPGMPEKVRAAVLAAANGENFREEVTIHVPAGPRSYDFSIRPIRDRHGAIIAIVPEAADTTERRQAEEALRQSQKMEAVGQLTGGLAHDFNNLLTGITGSLELLQTRMAQGRVEDCERYITAAQGASRRAAALTHRLLAFSRQQTLDPKAVDVNDLVQGMEELVRRTVGPAVAVEVAAAAGLWTTLVDPNQLESALLNLCINARDAMPDGGRLTIETGNHWLDDEAAHERALPPGQYVSLGVSDTGTGMAPEVIARAFDPFFTTKPLGQGTGLGLSMIYGFARQSGGQVHICSQLGRGTTVRLYLPRHMGEAEAADVPAKTPAAPRAGRGETVLIVDDEPVVRMLVTEVLGDLGYVAIEVADGAAGLRVLQSDARIDLLITDVGLPGVMNGRQVADAGQLLRPGLRVLFITGYADHAVIGDGRLAAGMHVLTKPFAIETLASRIKDLIAGGLTA